MVNTAFIRQIAKTIRYYILRSTTLAGSGHLTSSLSAVDLMTTLFIGKYFRYDISNPNNPYNDILIFSKGHAAPLFYVLWASVGGILYEELDTLRKFNSRLEGHPTLKFPYTFAPTGSLGQGLSIGVGAALANKLKKIDSPKIYILLGDGELTEGSNWEAIAIASYYKINSLCAIVDINRLEQAGPTMNQWNIESYKKKFESFGWKTACVDGHCVEEIKIAYELFQKSEKPFAILAKTIKGKGLPQIENTQFHGKVLSVETYQKIRKSLFKNIDKKLKHTLKKPAEKDSCNKLNQRNQNCQPLITLAKFSNNKFSYSRKKIVESISTREAYGIGIARLGAKNKKIVVLDAGVSNSTYSEIFKNNFPERYFEMFIAEQNMIGVAVGMSRKGFIPFVSTFCAFLTRAFDQIRMAQYSDVHLILCGSHAGSSFGLDGSSQFGLEDIAMMRSIKDSVILYPSDYFSTINLLSEVIKRKGLYYLRTTRMNSLTLYKKSDSFSIGGSKTLRSSKNDQITIIGAGITVHESLKAYEMLKQKGILVRIVDLYSIKPIDYEMLEKATTETKAIIVVEDHYTEGGIYDAVCHALGKQSIQKSIYQLSVSKIPITGQPHELLSYEEIDSTAIVKKTLNVLSSL